MAPKKLSKRPVLLLEVLIAFALVALCIFPLMAPHVFILKSQYEFNHKIMLDQTASRLYTKLLEKIYRNEIPWESFKQKQVFPIEAQLLQSVGLDQDFPYGGTYSFALARHKGSKERPFSANVIKLKIDFKPKITSSTGAKKELEPFVYHYQFFGARIHDKHETTHP